MFIIKIIEYDFNMTAAEKREAICDFVRSFREIPSNYQNEIIELTNAIIDDSEAISCIGELIESMITI